MPQLVCNFDMSGDVADALPPRAAEKFRALRDRAEELHSVIRGLSDQVQPTWLESQKAENALRILTDRTYGLSQGLSPPRPMPAMTEGGQVLTMDPQIKAAEERDALARAAYARIFERREVASARWQPVQQVVT